MKEITLSSSPAITVRLGEQVFTVRKPTNRMIKELSEAPEKEGLNMTIAMLDKLGLPESVCWDLAPDSLQEITQALMGSMSEKKS